MQERGNFQNSAQRQCVLSHLQVLADGKPSPSSGVVRRSLQCIFLPTFLLEDLNVHFSSLNAASLQAALIDPLFQVFAVL